MHFSRLADNYVVAEQIQATDIAEIAAQGFATVICNRPDNEEPGQPSAAEVAAACEAADILFHHIPVAVMPIADEVAQAHRAAIDASDGPVLAYCRSGQRSTLIWQTGL